MDQMAGVYITAVPVHLSYQGNDALKVKESAFEIGKEWFFSEMGTFSVFK